MPKSSKSTRERDRGTPREVDRVPRVVDTQTGGTPRECGHERTGVPASREEDTFFLGTFFDGLRPSQFTANGWKKRRG